MKELTPIEKDNLLHKNVALIFEKAADMNGFVVDVSTTSITIQREGAGNIAEYHVSELEGICILPDSVKDKNYESNDNMVSHPPHYQSATGLEVIDVIEAFTTDLIGIEAADTANVIKYICRWNSKNGLQDLKKAMWYLTHLINHVEKSEKECN